MAYSVLSVLGGNSFTKSPYRYETTRSTLGFSFCLALSKCSKCSRHNSGLLDVRTELLQHSWNVEGPFTAKCAGLKNIEFNKELSHKTKLSRSKLCVLGFKYCWYPPTVNRDKVFKVLKRIEQTIPIYRRKNDCLYNWGN